MPRKAPAPITVDATLLAAARENAQLRQENLRLKRLRDEALSELHAVEARSGYLDIVNRQEIPTTDIPTKKIGGESTAILALSDWHWEENVDPELAGGKNSYTPQIAASRAKGMFQRAAGLIDLFRGFTTINELIIAVLGDMITGYIHEELEENNWLSPTEASLEVQEHLVSGIEFLRKETKAKRIIIPTCYGNHGRTTRKMRFASGYANSYEWLLYKQLAWHYRNDKVVQWRVGKGYHNCMPVQGHLVRFHHGDAIKYQGGIGGISIPVNKAIAAWNKADPVALDIFGHYHQSKEDRWWVSNGSLIGYNSYSVQIKADYEEPSQSLIVVSRKRGKIITTKVFCE